jgi:hypothetical protein
MALGAAVEVHCRRWKSRRMNYLSSLRCRLTSHRDFHYWMAY